MRPGTFEWLTGRGLHLVTVTAVAVALSLSPTSSALAVEDGPEEATGMRDFSGAELSPQQKLSFAQSTAADLQTTINKILALVTEAQQRKDVILLNCLNDKLIGLRGLLKVAEDGKLNLQEAIARENLDLQEHNYRKVAIAEDQARLITAEAEACAGAAGYSDAAGTIVSVTVEGQSTGGADEFGTPNDSATRPADSSPSN